MASKDLHNNLHFVPAIAPVAARTDNTAVVSAIIDTLGFESLEFAIITGTNTDADATFAVTVDEGDASNLAGSNAVAAAQLLGTLTQASFAFGDDVECRKIGYVGNKRYVRLTVTPTGNAAGDIFLAAIAVLGNSRSKPTATLS